MHAAVKQLPRANFDENATVVTVVEEQPGIQHISGITSARGERHMRYPNF